MNKKLLIALGCASIMVCGCGKQVEELEPINQNDEEYEFVTIVSGNKYDLYSHMNLSDRPEYQFEDVTIDFSYPVINIESDEIKKINESIKESYEETERQLPKSEGDGCVCIKSDDKYLCNGEHLESQEYLTYETDKYLTLKIRRVGRTYCAGGYDSFTFYNIDKNTKKVLSDDELLKALNFDKAKYEQEVKNQYQKDYGMELNNLEYVKIGIYNDNSLIVVIPGENYNDVYTYDGNTLTILK